MNDQPPAFPADPRPDFERAADQMSEVIAAVDPARLGAPTPCEDYDVRGLLGHVVDVMHRIAHAGRGGAASEAPAPPESVPDDGWPAAYAEARAQARSAWADDAKLDAPVTVPFGEFPGRGVLSAWTMETVAHTWDLAQAAEWREPLDPELAAVALGVAHQMLPPERRGEGVPFGPVRPAPEGAGPYDELAAWLGRRVDRAEG